MILRTPQDTFLSDQTLAAAREAAADPAVLPIALTAANNQQCSWCDCSDGPDSPHNDRRYRCPGCPADAKYVVSVFTGPTVRYDYPTCERHHPDIVASITALAGGRS